MSGVEQRRVCAWVGRVSLTLSMTAACGGLSNEESSGRVAQPITGADALVLAFENDADWSSDTGAERSGASGAVGNALALPGSGYDGS